jgi:hypothetical protein
VVARCSQRRRSFPRKGFDTADGILQMAPLVSCPAVDLQQHGDRADDACKGDEGAYKGDLHRDRADDDCKGDASERRVRGAGVAMPTIERHRACKFKAGLC